MGEVVINLVLWKNILVIVCELFGENCGVKILVYVLEGEECVK